MARVDTFRRRFAGITTMPAGHTTPKSVDGGEMAYRAFSSLTASALGNLLPEFWPDLKVKLARYKHR